MTTEQAFEIMAKDRGEGFEADILDTFFEIKSELESLLENE